MTIVSWGWQGTIDELQWARMASLLGNPYCVDAPSSCAPTAVAGQRTVNVATGILFGKGISSQVTAAERPVIPVPVNGQWYMLVLRRSWAAKTAVLTVLPHTVTAGTAVAAASTAPTTNAPGFTQNPGVTDDAPVAWVHANSMTADLTVVSLLKESAAARLDKLAPEASSVAQRNALFPGTPAQGSKVYRRDLLMEETYFALYNASTNPAGANPAGWYPTAGNTPLGVMDRSGTQNTIALAYQDLALNVNWVTGELQGGMTYSDGFVVPVAGVYRLSASIHLVSSTGVLVGFYLGNLPASVPEFKGAAIAGALQSNSVANPHYVQRFNAGDKIKMAGLNSPGTGTWPGGGASNFACEYVGPPR